MDLELTWTAPTHNTDGSDYLDPAGYHICLSVGTPIPADLKVADMATACTVSAQAGDGEVAATESVDIVVRTAGTVYARIAAIDTSGNVSVFSAEASDTFDFMPADGNEITVTIRKK